MNAMIENIIVTTLHIVKLNDLPEYLDRHSLKRTRTLWRAGEIVVETEARDGSTETTE